MAIYCHSLFQQKEVAFPALATDVTKDGKYGNNGNN